MRNREGVPGLESQRARLSPPGRVAPSHVFAYKTAVNAPLPAAMRETKSPTPNEKLPPPDPRWALAVKVSQMLQGPVLTADARRDLVQFGESLGLRPFEANLIIALVQDQARSGGSLYKTRQMLNLMPQPTAHPRHTIFRIALLVFGVIAAEIVVFCIICHRG